MNAPSTMEPEGKIAHALFAVPGLRCAGCIATIEQGLSHVPGISAARVNFTARQLSVHYFPELRLPDIKAAIEKLGFESEPIQAKPDSTDHKETSPLLRATAVAGFAAMNIMLLSVSVWSGAIGPTRDLFHLLSALIAIPTLFYSGRPFFRSAWGALRHGRTNMDVPISIGVSLVTALSLYEALTGGPHAYFDGAVMLLFFLLVGRLLDSIMRDRARDGVTALLKQTAPGGLVLKADGTSEWLEASALSPGMLVRVAAGERLAADGIVESGASLFDLSLLSGESEPRPVVVGDKVHAGTLNLDSPLSVRISAAGSDTAIADIARLMEQAGQARSYYVRLADRAARWYAPAVHTLAIAAFIGWIVAGAGWHQAMLIAAAVLIITCPCALGLAVPAAQIVAAGALMRAGVLVKDGSTLERLAEADRALFDKTGTLTLGRPAPIDLEQLPPALRGPALGLARASTHPLSQAIRRALEAKGTIAAPLEEIREVPGAGVHGLWQGRPVSLARPGGVGTAGSMAVAFTVGGEPPILLHFHDSLRPGAELAIRQLEALGIACSVASGDRTAAVAPVARGLGLTAQTNMSPTDKLETIARLTAAGRKILMIGDGLNDGPALSAAHVSMAPASASDVGQNAADAVFLGDSLEPIPAAIRAARRTMRVVRQNFAIAITYNALAVPLALAGLVTPLVAALAMSGSSIVVVANALRLRGAAR